jgi:hypothetical protein
MFERFTERARMVVVLAQEEARTLRHNYIGTEHFLLGLLREEDGLGGQVLRDLDITIEQARARIVGSAEEETMSAQIPFTPRAKKLLELALCEAFSLGHSYIGTEHLLLALVREGEGVAVRILRELDADGDVIHNEVLRLLAAPRGHDVELSGWTAVAPGADSPGRYSLPALDWNQATVLWRPEGLELRIPTHLNRDAVAALAVDNVWSKPPLEGMRREIWNGWLALASPSLLDDVDPGELRLVLDAAAQRALAVVPRWVRPVSHPGPLGG